MNRCAYTNEVLYSERSWSYIQVSFESLFSLMELLNMQWPEFEVMLGQH
jgi:hypothetical protein